MNKQDLSYIRCTVDRRDDLHFIIKLFNKLQSKNMVVAVSDILKIVKSNPELVKINNKISFDEGYRNSILKDKETPNKC